MKQVQISVDNFNKLKHAVKWYDDMPAFIEVPDSFHELVTEQMEELVPSEGQLVDEDHYIGGVDLTDDKLIVTLISVEDFNAEVKVELIPAQDSRWVSPIVDLLT